MNQNDIISNSFLHLKKYCEKEQFKGFDPFDGLNSPIFQSIPIVNKNKFARLAWLQFFKRSPVNFRRIAGIKKEYNPKAIGLFLSAYVILEKSSPSDYNKKCISHFIDLLKELRSEGYSGDCWGYNFDWQAKAFFQPKGTPTIVATSFIANALMDAYEILGTKELLESAVSSCRFILKDLNRAYDQNDDFAFSYSPIDHSVVYNASFLGARLLIRVYKHTGDNELLKSSRSAINYCCKKQKNDGSWSYGNYQFHQWIDNFHTGYNLECLSDYHLYSGSNEFDSYLKKGFDFYINTFFKEDGTSKYYHDRLYPIDIHAPSQLIMTLSHLNKLEEFQTMASKVLIWTIDKMQAKNGSFIYQINKWGKSPIAYMRWSQAWMFLALTTFLHKNKISNEYNR